MYCSNNKLQITRTHVLTSAHCVSPFLRLVRLGAYDLSPGNDGLNSLDFTIEKTIVHEEYQPDIILNDIAMIKLRRQTPVNGECTIPACDFEFQDVLLFIHQISYESTYRSDSSNLLATL